MAYTVTNISTGKTETIHVSSAKAAMEAYRRIRVYEINAEYAGAKFVNSSRVETKADGRYELRDGAEIVRFAIVMKTGVPAVKDFEAGKLYQDATTADWDSGKFHS